MAHDVDFQYFEQALKTLEEGLSVKPKNDLERDGVIQRFEYTFELAWKAGMKALGAVGIDSQSPKSVIRDMAQQGWITDAGLWMDFLSARNRSVHTYKKTTAEEVFDTAKKFPTESRKLLKALKAAVKS